MDELSPFLSQNTRKSRYSLYQSDYETAGEESDNSFYYSVLDDEDTESDSKDTENSMNRSNAPSGRRSLLGKCLLSQLKHTPHNEFAKRVSFNHLLKPTTSPAVVNQLTIGSQNSSSIKLDDTRHSFLNIDNFSTKLSYPMTQNESAVHLRKSHSSFESFTQMLESEITSSIDTASSVALDTTRETDKDQSLNSTIVENSNHQTEIVNEPTEQSPVCLEEEAVELGVDNNTITTATTLDPKPAHVHYGNEKSGATEQTSLSKKQNVSTSSRLSCLPVPRQHIASSMFDLSNGLKHLNLPLTSRSSKLYAYSTENIGGSKPKGRTNIPKVPSIGTNTRMASSQRNVNNTTHASVIPLFSLKCKYCDKTFAKKNILDVHLLEKCDKIPSNRYRQLLNYQDSSKM